MKYADVGKSGSVRIQESGESLAQQAHLFHAALFGEAAPALTVDRYIAACRVCFPEIEERDARILSAMVRWRLDPEALELALRLARGTSIVTRKLQAYLYLVEVLPEYYSYFVNTRPGLIRGIWEIIGAAVKSAGKWIKGRFLVARHGLL